MKTRFITNRIVPLSPPSAFSQCCHATCPCPLCHASFGHGVSDRQVRVSGGCYRRGRTMESMWFDGCPGGRPVPPGGWLLKCSIAWLTMMWCEYGAYGAWCTRVMLGPRWSSISLSNLSNSPVKQGQENMSNDWTSQPLIHFLRSTPFGRGSRDHSIASPKCLLLAIRTSQAQARAETSRCVQIGAVSSSQALPPNTIHPTWHQRDGGISVSAFTQPLGEPSLSTIKTKNICIIINHQLYQEFQPLQILYRYSWMVAAIPPLDRASSNPCSLHQPASTTAPGCRHPLVRRKLGHGLDFFRAAGPHSWLAMWDMKNIIYMESQFQSLPKIR